MSIFKHVTTSKPALKITLIYVVLGFLWIFFSDMIAYQISIDLKQSKLFSLLKGVFYVLATSYFLYYLIMKQIKRSNSYIHLLNSQNRLMNFIMQKQAGLLVLVIDNEGKIILASGTEKLIENQTFESLTGHYLNEWLIDRVWYDTINNIIQRTFKNENSKIDIEISGQHYHIEGRTFDDTVNSLPICCIQISNITDMHQIVELNSIQKFNIENLTQELEITLEQVDFNQELLDGIMNGLPESTFIHTIDHQAHLGPLLKANFAATIMFNCKNSDLLEYDIFNFLTFKDSNAITLLHENDFNKISSFTFQAKLQPLRSRKQIDVEIKTRLVAFSKQKYAITTVRDLTETNSEIDNLRSDYNKLVEYYNHLEEGVLIVEKESNPIFGNKALEDIFENKPDKQHPLGWISIMEEKLGFKLSFAINQAFEGQIISLSNRKFKHDNKWITVRMYPNRNSIQQIDCIIITIKIVTELIYLENQVIDLKQKLESSNLLRSVFLSNLSHEIRTPMNGIVGFIELMEMEDLNKIQHNYLNLIKQSSQHLLTIVEAIYEITYLQNNQESINNTWVKPFDVLLELVDYTLATLSVQKKNTINLVKNIDDHTKEMLLFTDQDKLVKALKYLCHNAVKFTQRGSIVISCKLNSNDSLEFIISDTGIGIDPRNLTAIFLPFISFKNNSDEIYGGIGLGLAISKALIEMLGGSIEVESQINRGANFFVSIPIKLSTRSIQPKIGVNNLEMRIRKAMIIQYSFEGIEKMEEIFIPFNITVIQEINGMSAIETFYEQQDIDLVICDIRLSDMDAFEVFRAIKRINQSTIFIAQTAYFLVDERRKCLDAGFSDYIVKPITSSTIIGILTNPSSN